MNIYHSTTKFETRTKKNINFRLRMDKLRCLNINRFNRDQTSVYIHSRHKIYLFTNFDGLYADFASDCCRAFKKNLHLTSIRNIYTCAHISRIYYILQKLKSTNNFFLGSGMNRGMKRGGGQGVEEASVNEN